MWKTSMALVESFNNKYDRAKLKPSTVPYQKNHRDYASEGQIPRQLWRCEKAA